MKIFAFQGISICFTRQNPAIRCIIIPEDHGKEGRPEGERDRMPVRSVVNPNIICPSAERIMHTFLVIDDGMG